jgi:26S proteasome regulatory subunit N11
MLKLAQAYTKSVREEQTMTAEQLKVRHVGKQDPKRHLQDAVEKAMGEQVTQSLAMGVLAEVSLFCSYSIRVKRLMWRCSCEI